MSAPAPEQANTIVEHQAIIVRLRGIPRRLRGSE